MRLLVLSFGPYIFLLLFIPASLPPSFFPTSESNLGLLAHTQEGQFIDTGLWWNKMQCKLLWGVPSKSPGQLVLKRPELLKSFQGKVYKDRVREGVGGVCDQLLDILPIPWQWGKQESTLSTFWFQMIWAVYRSLLPPGGGVSICKITQRTWLRILSTDLEEELNVLDFA